MKQEIALKTRCVQTIVDLVYTHNLPVQLTLQQGSTPSGLRILEVEHLGEDEKLVEWLFDKATAGFDTEVCGTAQASPQSAISAQPQTSVQDETLSNNP